MADLKISQLTGASTPLAGTEVLPIVQSGSTKKVSVADLTAGRAVASAGGTFSDNFVQGVAGKGVNFTANTNAPGMTSELLNWYEEGAWTPSVGGTATYFVQEGYYTRVGRLVYIRAKIVIDVLGTGSTTTISGLPFTCASSVFAIADTINVNYYNSLAVNALAISGLINSSTSDILFNVSTAAGVTTTTSPAAIFGNFARVDFSGCYQAA